MFYAISCMFATNTVTTLYVNIHLMLSLVSLKLDDKQLWTIQNYWKLSNIYLFLCCSSCFISYLLNPLRETTLGNKYVKRFAWMKSFFYSRDVLVKKSTLELTSTSAPAILICANAAHDQVDIVFSMLFKDQRMTISFIENWTQCNLSIQWRLDAEYLDVLSQ